MYSFIDLHNHSLCHVDDGARSHKMMESMLDIAYNDGIKTICFTPHFKIYHFDSDEDFNKYSEACNMFFKDALSYVEKMGYDLTLLLGNEIMFHNDIFDNITSGKCKKINNTQYVLVEFTPYVSDFDLKSALTNLSRKGYKPILAHFERYECIAKSPALLSDLKNCGILIQVNANSIVKPKLGKAGKLVKMALKKHLVDIVATDAHDDKALTPILSKAHSVVVKKYGSDYAKKIFHDNQNSIVNNICVQQGE